MFVNPFFTPRIWRCIRIADFPFRQPSVQLSSPCAERCIQVQLNTQLAALRIGDRHLPTTLLMTAAGRVRMWRGGLRSSLSVSAPFVWRCLNSSTITPFPHPPHRTGHADFPHPALGQDITFSPTARHVQVASGVRDRSTRRGETGERCHPGDA